MSGRYPITIEFVDASDTRRRVRFRPVAGSHERTTAILDDSGDVKRVTGREFVSEMAVDVEGYRLVATGGAATAHGGP